MKVFERRMFAQMLSFFNNFLSKQQYDFQKGYSTQQCLLALLENGNEPLIVVKCLVLYWQTFLGHLIVSITNYLFENLTHTVSAYQLFIADNINGVITFLEKASKALFEWFQNNSLKSNTDKCHLLASSSDAVSIRVSEYDI